MRHMGEMGGWAKKNTWHEVHHRTRQMLEAHKRLEELDLELGAVGCGRGDAQELFIDSTVLQDEMAAG